MRNSLKHSAITIVILVLTACDIQSVSVGEWDISVNAAGGEQQSIWTISEQGSITMESQGLTIVTETELAGSRLSWTGEYIDASGQSHSANFSGTVDGNSLEGTIFTQEGNMTVAGSRM